VQQVQQVQLHCTGKMSRRTQTAQFSTIVHKQHIFLFFHYLQKENFHIIELPVTSGIFKDFIHIFDIFIPLLLRLPSSAQRADMQSRAGSPRRYARGVALWLLTTAPRMAQAEVRGEHKKYDDDCDSAGHCSRMKVKVGFDLEGWGLILS